ncbi:MAG: hypothetical protein KAW12_31135 [Candidatus Aminicenantes bacterium]|nr:hypothetical protein [Candidatus Aminicenantes bacterium]
MSAGLEVILLLNSAEYGLNFVCIAVQGHNYRLVVFRGKSILTDRCYSTLKGAKLAFAGMYNRRSYRKGVRPDWSFFSIHIPPRPKECRQARHLDKKTGGDSLEAIKDVGKSLRV